MYHFQIAKLPRLKRENVSERNFRLNRLTWTPWQLAIIPEYSGETGGRRNWRKRKNGRGYIRHSIFGGKFQYTALYECAVQRRRRTKRYVVYSVSSSGFKTSWGSRLLDKRAKNQVDKVLRQGCSVYIRRAILTSHTKQEVVQSLKLYDYAWRKLRLHRFIPRRIVKSSIKLSGL